MLRFTLATRLVLIGMIGFSAVSIVIITVFYLTSVRENEMTRPTPGRIAAITELVEQSDPGKRAPLLDAISSPQFIVRITNKTEKAEPAIISRIQAELDEIYGAALSGRTVKVSAPVSPSGWWFPRLTRMMANRIEIRIALHTGDTLVIDASTRLPVNLFGLPVGFGAGLFGTVVAFLALLVMQRETRPLARLAIAVDRVDLSAAPLLLPDAHRSAPEIRAVIAAFNRLQARLSEMLRARMTLVGGIAHDVRTFATRLRLRVETISDEVEQQRAIADIDDMIRLLDDALLSSRIGAGQLSQTMVEFVALVQAEADDRRVHGFQVQVVSDEAARNAIVLGDRLALRRVVANIFDNAVKYGLVAHIKMLLKDHAIVLTVDDEGPGIPPEKREAMLEPFNRLETSRNRSTGGAGLGLAVARSLVEAHGGSIEIAEAPCGGARIIICLPTFDATQC